MYVDEDTTVKSVVLPNNGRLVLGPAVTIKISPGVECEGWKRTSLFSATMYW